MTEITLSQVQAAEMGFLRIVHGATPVRTEVRWRPGQETTLAPLCSNLRPFRSKCTVLKKNLASDIVGTFRRRRMIRRPGQCAPLAPPRYTSGLTLHNKVRSCEIRRVLNVEPLLPIERSQLRCNENNGQGKRC